MRARGGESSRLEAGRMRRRVANHLLLASSATGWLAFGSPARHSVGRRLPTVHRVRSRRSARRRVSPSNFRSSVSRVSRAAILRVLRFRKERFTLPALCSSLRTSLSILVSSVSTRALSADVLRPHLRVFLNLRPRERASSLAHSRESSPFRAVSSLSEI